MKFKYLRSHARQYSNAREIVVTLGEQAGVKKGRGDSSDPLQIIDPVSKMVLDTVDRERSASAKIRVRPLVYDLQDIPDGQWAHKLEFQRILAKNMLPDPWPETLRIDGSSELPPLSENDSYVKINDRVIMVSDD